MALNIEDRETERLAAEIAEMTGETETGAVRGALREKRERLEERSRGRGSARKERPGNAQEWLEKEIWPHIPEGERGKPLTKAEVEDILGFGPGGV